MLTLIMLLPLVGVLLCAILPKRREGAAKWIALVITGIDLILAAIALVQFKTGAGMQYVVQFDWIHQLGIQYYVGVDGLSLPIVALSSLLCFLAVIGSWKIDVKPKFYFAMILLLETGMNGVFSALDFVLFYVFWEIVLVPMYFIISQWGGQRRQYAAIKFFLYTFFGSVFMLVGIIALYLKTGTFDMIAMQSAHLGSGAVFGFQWWVFAAFFIGFAVKVPIWPLHTWLSDAHTEAPTAASVLLAGVMLKMGTYGFLRIALPILPQTFHHWQYAIAILGVISIVYGGLVAFAQTDMKRLVAYSSVAHMGFAMLGIASGTVVGLNAAMAVNIAHGLNTGMLFFLVGMIYDRTHTRQISELSGIASKMPVYAGIFCFAGFAGMGIPLLSGFIGEFLSIVGAWTSPAIPHWLVVIAGIGILIGATYMLWLIQRVIFGTPSPAVEAQSDISVREVITVVPLAALTLAIGVAWFLLLNFTDPVANAIGKLIGG
ncbi:MAG: NADH-quinone oxidoreductase subunit M [Coriobacteriia bacterium]|nr:NADH-quinone oxidoreductase subunit M [Coriobacteriia bacterium]